MQLSTKQAIEQRRSIRKFKPDAIPTEVLLDLLDSARLAPSGSNAQPWRFKIVTDQKIKEKLAEAAHNQKFIAQAPVVIVCCANIKDYLNDMSLGVQDLAKTNEIDSKISHAITGLTDKMKTLSHEQLGQIASFNVAIAIEHIALRALDYGLGTCWIKLIDANTIKRILDMDDTLHVVALLPLGYPAEHPAPRKRLSLEEIII